MNRRMRMAVLSPLSVSALALGSMTFFAAPAQSAAPSCAVAQGAGTAITVTGKSFVPNKTVVIDSGGSDGSAKANATGVFTVSLPDATGTVTAQQINGAAVKCGTVEEQKASEDKAAFDEGWQAGFKRGKDTCKTTPLQGEVANSEQFNKGFDAGAKTAVDKFC
ncbi:hypothetical protein [Streptomyces sp. NBC_01483]|uniref:hypothetical protein n=1 Tax=Streptomyces sp. NBC_01483 TaxID=2903883 RepID=UPI002E333F73|nr:hypothetical protein [Streptomyces sp. NBC_01483]